jgi:uncharacterized protein YceK
MKKLLFAVTIMLFYSSAFSQTTLEVKYDTDAKGNYNFYCINNDFCKYILTIDFPGSINIKTYVFLPYQVVVNPGRTNIMTVQPENIGNSVTLRYSYSFQKGCLNPKVNPDFVYLLPVGKGKTTEVFELGFLKINTNDPEPKDFYVVGFKMKFQDTVYAARRGVVSGINDAAKLQLTGYTYSSDDNFIEIYHDDCTFGKYQVFSKILVTPGQKVEAGDPIGLAGGEKYTSGPHVRFSVYYNYEQEPADKKKDAILRKKYWAYVPMNFCTTEAAKTKLVKGKLYTGDYPDAIITQEMTKNQIKKWEKDKAKPVKK